VAPLCGLETKEANPESVPGNKNIKVNDGSRSGLNK